MFWGTRIIISRAGSSLCKVQRQVPSRPLGLIQGPYRAPPETRGPPTRLRQSHCSVHLTRVVTSGTFVVCFQRRCCSDLRLTLKRAVSVRPSGLMIAVTLETQAICAVNIVLVAVFVFAVGWWHCHLGRMILGLSQWLMDNVRYFQDDDLMAEQTMQCKEAFSAFDKYGRGTIPVKDLKDVMRYLGLNPTENDIISIMADLDLDSTSKIKLDDFIQVMLEKMREMDSEEEIRKVFKVFDKDNNGLLSAAELKYMMTNMGHKFEEEEFDELMRGADVNFDGSLNYEEFVQMLLS